MPRLFSVYSVRDEGAFEEPAVEAAGYLLSIKHLFFAGLGALTFVVVAAWCSLTLALPLASVAALPGFLPSKIPLRYMLRSIGGGKGKPEGEEVYLAPGGSIVVYAFAEERTRISVRVDGDEFMAVEAGPLVRVELGGLEPGVHEVRLVAGDQVLRALRVVVGERRATEEW